MSERRKAIGYCRVSTAHQVANGVSMTAQEERIGAWCLARDFDLVRVYREPARSGAKLDRPQLEAAVVDVCRRSGVLVSYSLSRISRSARDCCNLMARLEESGASFASLTETVDTSTPTGRAFLTIASAFSQLEKEMVRQRFAHGYEEARRLGRRISGRLPYGWRLNGSDGKTLRKDPHEQKGLAFLKRLYRQRLPMKTINTRMLARGYPPRQAKAWSRQAVGTIMAREGVTRCGM